MLRKLGFLLLLCLPVGAQAQIFGGNSGANAASTLDYQPGLLTAVLTGKGAYVKVVHTSTVDNIEGSAIAFTCSGNPTATLYECGTDANCGSPTTIGSVTVTGTGVAFDGTVSSSTITAGDYIAWAISGTCASLDIQATAQIHTN